MDNFLIESTKNDTYSLRKLVKYFAYLFSVSILVTICGCIIYIILLIQLYTTCQAQTGQQVCITQIIGYLLQGAFSFACLQMLSLSTLLYVNIFVSLTAVAKGLALIFTIIVKNRNWGECYISQQQGIMLICTLCIEICILFAMYGFARKLYFKLEQKSLKVPLKMLFQ